MSKNTVKLTKRTVGIDLGDKESRICVLDEQGRVLEQSSLQTTRAAFKKRFGDFSKVLIALEVGTHSPWASRTLEDLGHDVLVANPRKVRLISQNDAKCDRTDAELLARLARADPALLSPIKHRGEQAQADRAVIQARKAAVGGRTSLINHVRGTVKSIGARLPSCSAEAFAKTVAEHVPKEIRAAISALLKIIDQMTKAIRAYDKQIERIAAKRYPETAILQDVPGIGPLTALAYVLTIEDPRRFKKSRTVGAYLGLRPKTSASGESNPQLRITKAGDVYVRTLLVQSAHYILGPFGPDSDLRRWGFVLASRGGKNAKKRAIVAVARKLAILLHRLWVTGEVYRPLREPTGLDAGAVS